VLLFLRDEHDLLQSGDFFVAAGLFCFIGLLGGVRQDFDHDGRIERGLHVGASLMKLMRSANKEQVGVKHLIAGFDEQHAVAGEYLTIIFPGAETERDIQIVYNDAMLG